MNKKPEIMTSGRVFPGDVTVYIKDIEKLPIKIKCKHIRKRDVVVKYFFPHDAMKSSFIEVDTSDGYISIKGKINRTVCFSWFEFQYCIYSDDELKDFREAGYTCKDCRWCKSDCKLDKTSGICMWFDTK